MLAYILEIKKQGNKGITNWGRFQGLQMGARGITNRGSLKDFKSGQKECKSVQGFQIGAKRFQTGAEITNQDKRDYKLGQGLQIGAEHSLDFLKMSLSQTFGDKPFLSIWNKNC